MTVSCRPRMQTEQRVRLFNQTAEHLLLTGARHGGEERAAVKGSG